MMLLHLFTHVPAYILKISCMKNDQIRSRDASRKIRSNIKFSRATPI